jgi:gluconate 2-dehydrogenase gamma chain
MMRADGAEWFRSDYPEPRGRVEITSDRIDAALAELNVETLAAIVERLIPSDDTGPGAREAKVTRYLLRALGDEYAEHVGIYRDALAAVDAFARLNFGATFSDLPPVDQDIVLEGAESNTLATVPPLPEAFFALVRQHTLEGMFGDPRWGGNANELGWQLLGYPGPRATWTSEDQRIEAIDVD